MSFNLSTDRSSLSLALVLSLHISDCHRNLWAMSESIPTSGARQISSRPKTSFEKSLSFYFKTSKSLTAFVSASGEHSLCYPFPSISGFEMQNQCCYRNAFKFEVVNESRKCILQSFPLGFYVRWKLPKSTSKKFQTSWDQQPSGSFSNFVARFVDVISPWARGTSRVPRELQNVSCRCRSKVPRFRRGAKLQTLIPHDRWLWNKQKRRLSWSNRRLERNAISEDFNSLLELGP
jgi:hypothetical protein